MSPRPAVGLGVAVSLSSSRGYFFFILGFLDFSAITGGNRGLLRLSLPRASRPRRQTARPPRSARAHQAATLPREELRPRGGAATTKSRLRHTPT